MLKRFQHGLVFSVAMFFVTTGPASADDTKAALTEFGWEGTWSVDCSLPVVTPDTKRSDANAIRRYHVVPRSGQATETSSSAGPDYVNRITSANIVRGSERTLRIHYIRDDKATATEADEMYVMRGGKLMMLQGVTAMTAKRFLPPGPIVLDGLDVGQTVKWKSVLDGRFLDTDGIPKGNVELLERCTGPSS